MISFKLFVEEMETLEEKNVPTSPEKWARAKAAAKAKFAVYPSAYANGWASKKYKAMGGGWRSTKEEVELDESATAKSGIVQTDVYGSKAYHAKCMEKGCDWKSKRYDRIKQAQDAAKKHAQTHFGNTAMKEEIELDETAAWQRSAGKNPEGGLNRKGIASYRREHPGSKLSMAVTTKPSKLKKGSKAAKRRKSFCARMSGMKRRLTSAKTARDPNSRINKALRKWNC
jgi:Domain of unknown function (DUF6321)